ncbi:amidase family protein [Serratia ureilytica]
MNGAMAMTRGCCRASPRRIPGDADLQLLQRQRADWQRRVTAELQRFDALLMPTVPMVAPTIGELAADDAYFRCNGLMLRNPAIVNFLDGCALSAPASGRAPRRRPDAGGLADV